MRDRNRQKRRLADAPTVPRASDVDDRGGGGKGLRKCVRIVADVGIAPKSSVCAFETFLPSSGEIGETDVLVRRQRTKTMLRFGVNNTGWPIVPRRRYPSPRFLYGTHPAVGVHRPFLGVSYQPRTYARAYLLRWPERRRGLLSAFEEQYKSWRYVRHGEGTRLGPRRGGGHVPYLCRTYRPNGLAGNVPNPRVPFCATS